MADLAYTDLLTPSDIKLKAFNSLSIDVTSENDEIGIGQSYKDLCIDAIQDVTDAIESYLDRTLIVRKVDIDIPDYKWTENEALEKMQFYPAHNPIVQVATSGVSASNDKNRLLANSEANEVTYYGGYKRKEQTVGEDESTDIDSAANGLDELTETPPNCPNDIQRVAFRLVMYELTMAEQNSFAVASSTKKSGQATTEFTRSRQDVYDQELEKLYNYRRVL
jgi:hypothetical protein